MDYWGQYNVWGVKRYIITAVDVKTRYSFAWEYKRHDSQSTKNFLKKLEIVFPYKIKAIQTDNGSEFHKFFKDYLKEKKITHYWNYVGQPYKNGHVEKYNRTIQEEFIDQNEILLEDPDKFNQKLMDWLIWYNTKRYHWGLDLISPVEYMLNNNMVFTSNNTSNKEFLIASVFGGCILNLDDITLIDKISPDCFPEQICFRYNPGPRCAGNDIIGEPKEAKYGVSHEQIIEAYQSARDHGAKKFGLHTMICSNSKEGQYLVDTVQMLAEVANLLHTSLGIRLDFINMGGGLGIPYHPDDKDVDIEAMFADIVGIVQCLGSITGKTPKLFMEFGRYMTGPHGVLVMKAINVMQKYRKIIGVDASMPANPRPAVYGAYHEITAGAIS